MIAEKAVQLRLFNQPIKAKIVTLTAELAEKKLMRDWWEDDCLKRPLQPPPIDMFWDWNTYQVDYEGRILSAEKVAVVTGSGEGLEVQGAMLISAESIDSMDGRPCLLVELLFTAPRNRPTLRKDGKHFIVGVGTQMMIWAAWFSRRMGCEGRVRLDGSPDFVNWYEKIGLQRVNLEPIVYEDVKYTPMELSERQAQELLRIWNAD